MGSPAASVADHAPTYDPARHESLVIALFADDAAAERARSAVLMAGVAGERVEVMAGGAALDEGIWHPVQDLFVPEDDYHDLHHALGRGHALVIVRPASVYDRDVAVLVLENAAPLNVEANGRKWRGQSTVPKQGPTINHANVSRADMRNRAVGGHDEVILDMTGQKMTVRVMSETDMAEAPFAPPLNSAQRKTPLVPAVPARAAATRQTTYTFGVPADVVNRMSPEEQVLAQSPLLSPRRDTFLKEAGSHTQLGWRDQPTAAVRVRSYVSERPSEFREIDIHS